MGNDSYIIAYKGFGKMNNELNAVWSRGVDMPHFERLKSDISTDVLIIGGGIAGILCAYILQNAGVDCTVVEAGRICGGVTQNTTAKITPLHGAIYDKMLRRFGGEITEQYYNANLQAYYRYKAMCAQIDCDFEPCDSYVYSLDDKRKIEYEAAALKSIGAKAEYAKALPLPFDTAGAVKIADSAQFNPLKFLAAIAQNLHIYEHTRVLETANTTAICEGGRITAQNIVAATHFPLSNKRGAYFLKMYQSRSYVLALQNADNVQGMFRDAASGGLSFRNYGKLLLLGGGGARTGKTCGWDYVEKAAARYYPNSHLFYRYAAQDCMTVDDLPYVGHYSKNTPNWYVITGFNKWGMTNAMAGAGIVKDMILGKQNDYEAAFSPSRCYVRPQLFANAAHAVGNIVKPTAKRCVHMGCALKWNDAEHSWDCPCHGSRFSGEGELLDTPAQGDLKK